MESNKVKTRYDENTWHRYGYGRSFSFCITDKEMEDILMTSLLPQYQPYFLICTSRIKIDNEYIECQDIKPINQFLVCRKKYHYFNIASDLLTDIDYLASLDKKDLYLTANGTLFLQHGFIGDKIGWDSSSLGLVNKIYNEKTNEVVVHTEYEKIYNKLNRSIKKLLCFNSLWENKLGEVTDQKIRMSEDFVAKCISGEIQTKIIVGDRVV